MPFAMLLRETPKSNKRGGKQFCYPEVHHAITHHNITLHTTPHHTTPTPHHNTPTLHNTTLADTRCLGKTKTPGFEEKLNESLRKKFGEGTPFNVIAPAERVYDVVLGGVVINGLFQSKRNELANNTETNIKAEASGHHGWASSTLKDYYASGKPYFILKKGSSLLP